MGLDEESMYRMQKMPRPRIEKRRGIEIRKKCAARRDVSAEVGSWGARSGP